MGHIHTFLRQRNTDYKQSQPFSTRDPNAVKVVLISEVLFFFWNSGFSYISFLGTLS